MQFIVTILHQPKFFIFDEPFSGFDPINVNLLKNEILELKKNGASIIFSTHNMASVEELCDDIILINKSEKILEGGLREIKNQFKQHLFEVVFTASTEVELASLLPNDFHIESIAAYDNVFTALIKVEHTSANDLLTALLPYVSIQGFQEIFPSMNEIFISQVNKMNPMNN